MSESKETTSRIVLYLEQTDLDAILRVTAMRERMMPLPDGKGGLLGRTLAEICRGYEERITEEKEGEL